MKTVVGIIAEYNPFHNGHKLQLEAAKKVTGADYAVVVMSGNFVQRGEPAIFDKHFRAKTALLCGADLVLELPLFSAAQSAAYFAEGAINLLNTTGIVDYLCFGSESGDINLLKAVSDTISNETELFKSKLKSELVSGVSFPTARANAFGDVFDGKMASTPNDVLGIEYLLALNKLNSNKLNSKIQPFTIKREAADYHSETIEGEIASATAIRKAIYSGNTEHALNAIPLECRQLVAEQVLQSKIAKLDNLSSIFHYKLVDLGEKKLSQIAEISEGLENRFLKYAGEHYKISDIISSVKTKRYTYTRLSRAALNIILGVTKNQFDNYKHKGLAYVRVLGFKRSSQQLLSLIQERSSLPLITNLKPTSQHLNDYGKVFLDKELKATDIYYLSQNCYKANLSKHKVEMSIPLSIIP